MSFRVESLRGAGSGGGQIDYRLARESVLRDFRGGRVSKLDICDAHPELLRAARNVGRRSTRDCPICESDQLVLVSYAFGSRLPPGGRCITSKTEVTRLTRQVGEVACYVVEVCPECAWNHLDHTYVLGGSPR